jgi:hypothetical protein
MSQLLPDQTFYPAPSMAVKAAREEFAYVAMLNSDPGRPDAMAVVDVNPVSDGYGEVIRHVEMTGAGDELHHFGWNACSSCLCPYSPGPHMKRAVRGMRSSRIHLVGVSCGVMRSADLREWPAGQGNRSPTSRQESNTLGCRRASRGRLGPLQ